MSPSPASTKPAELAAAVLAEEERRRAEEAGRATGRGEELEGLELLIGASAAGETASLSAMVKASGAATIAVLFALNFLDEFDRAALAVLGPDIQRSLGLSDAALGLVASIGGFLVFLAAVPMGVLADRRSRTRLVGVCSLLWAGVGVVTGLVQSATQLLLTRVLSGLGKANEGPVQKAILADAYPLAGRNRIFALHNLANPVGIALGPALAGVIATLVGGPEGWRWSFVLLSIPAVIVALAALRLREPPRGRNERMAFGDLPDAVEAGDRRDGARVETEEAARLGAAFNRLRHIETLRSKLIAIHAI